MTDRRPKSDRLQPLLAAMLDGQLDDDQAAELRGLLAADPDARRQYVRQVATHGMLQWTLGSEPEVGASGVGVSRLGVWDSDRADVALPPPAPPVINLSAPSKLAYSFAGGWAFSYAVATVFMCLLLLGFWAYKLPSDRGSSIAGNENSRGLTANSRGLTAPGEAFRDRPAPVFVGRVTGMAGAKWSDDPDYIAPMGVRVALGRTYKLKTGLMEITYDSGAKVILEGPCSYEVDSTAGGYLALGKLVARMGARGEGRGAGEAASGQRPAASIQGSGSASLATNHQPLPTNSNPQSPIPNPLFSVRTPTAVVTDLGTEFGVEVAINGDTTSHVFEGTVVIQAGILGIGDAGMRDSDKRPATAVAGGESDQSVTLVAGQSVCVGRVREKDAEPAAGELMGGTGLARATLRFTHPSASPQFARRLQEPPKTLDLLDIVAGGNGLGTRREYGIDPTTGAIDAYFVARWRDGNGEYRKVSRHPMIDGVFVPNGKRSPVRIDSAGHEFDGFPPTSDIAWGSIWTRDAATKPGAGTTREHCWMHALGAADQYMPDRRGLLGLHPNSGISFDLGGIRRIYPDARPARFRAVAGMGDTSSRSTKVDRLADVWVFVDGQLKFHRRGLCPEAGPVIVDVELGPNDRYLTLATTDGAGEAGKYAGNWRAAAGDWVFYGDPTLQMSLIETAGRPLENRKEAALHSEQ